MRPDEVGRLVNAERRELARAIEVLHGLVAGVMADGVLNDSEIRFLDLWLTDNEPVTRVFPGSILADRVRRALKDGRVTDDERQQLQGVLAQMIGGTLQDTGSASIGVTGLPVDDDIDVHPDGGFCLTGSFIYGSRAQCEDLIAGLHGQSFADVTKDVDYLVIGTLGSKEWSHSSFGRKIEKAVAYQQKGLGIAIISEQRWLLAMNRVD